MGTIRPKLFKLVGGTLSLKTGLTSVQRREGNHTGALLLLNRCPDSLREGTSVYQDDVFFHQ